MNNSKEFFYVVKCIKLAINSLNHFKIFFDDEFSQEIDLKRKWCVFGSLIDINFKYSIRKAFYYILYIKLHLQPQDLRFQLFL